MMFWIVVLTICMVTTAQAHNWTVTGTLKYPRQWHTAVQLSNGNVLVAAGQNFFESYYYYLLSSAEVYAATTGVWTVTGSLTYARYFHVATILSNGDVLVAAGNDGNSALNSAELYNTITGIWTLTGSLTYARQWTTATLLPNGNVLVAGGQDSNGTAMNSAELYNAITGLWIEARNLTYARYQHTATLLPNGNVLVAGGTNGGALNSAELYNATTGVWIVIGSLKTARELHTATLLLNGNVLVAAGQNVAYLKSAELYNPSTGVWTVTGSLTYTRCFHTATLLSNGNVLVAAGQNVNGYLEGYLNSAELYNPSTGVWTVTGSLKTARIIATAALLPNGNVLIAGGEGTCGSGDSLNSAELYNSSTPIPIADLTPITSFSTPFDTSFPASTINGNAQLACGFIQLTDSNSVGETGSTYLTSPVDISKPFSVFYQVLIQCTSGSFNTTNCADGFAFVLQPTSTALLGNAGGSVAIEGASKPYWAIAAFTSTTMTLNLVTFPFSQSNYSSSTLAPFTFSGNTIYINVWLDYDPTGYVDFLYSSAVAVIRYSAQSSSTVPSKPSAATGVISSTSIQQVLNSAEAFIGFSAATSAGTEYHYVKLWTFQGSYCTPDLHPGCSSFALNSCYCQVCSTNYVSNGNGGCYASTTMSTPTPTPTPTTLTPTSSSTSSTDATPTPSSSAVLTSSPNAGAIAGGVIGSLVGLILLLLLSWFLRSRYWNEKEMSRSDNTKPMIPMSSSQSQRSVFQALDVNPSADVNPLFGTGTSSLLSNRQVEDDIYISFNSLRLGAVLGQGHFGQVHQADYTGAQVAVKKSKGIDEKLILEEARMMKNLPPHPNVLHYYGVSQENGEFMMVTELCDKGNLAQYLRNPNNNLTSQQCRQFCRQIASGMWHISKYGIIHRDLRAENILLSSTDTKLVAKVADFGLSRSLQSLHDQNDSAYYRMTELKPIPVAWTAPEVINDSLKYVAASDVWSFGVLMWEIYSKVAKPFDGMDLQLVATFIRDPNRTTSLLPRPSDCPDDIFIIMNSCWAFNPQDRPTFEQLYNQLS